MIICMTISMLQLSIFIFIMFISISTTCPLLIIIINFLLITLVLPTFLLFILREDTTTQRVWFESSRVDIPVVEADEECHVMRVFFRLLATFSIPSSPTAQPSFIPESFLSKVKELSMLME